MANAPLGYKHRSSWWAVTGEGNDDDNLRPSEGTALYRYRGAKTKTNEICDLIRTFLLLCSIFQLLSTIGLQDSIIQYISGMDDPRVEEKNSPAL